MDRPVSGTPPPAMIAGGAHQPIAHDSAAQACHRRGPSMSTTFRHPPSLLHLFAGTATKAHARVAKLDLAAVRAAPGVVAVLTAADIPGKNDVSPVGAGDDPVFCEGEVVFHGQVLFAVAGRELRRRPRRRQARRRRSMRSCPPLLTHRGGAGGRQLPDARSMSCAGAMPPRRIAAAPERLERPAPYRRPGSFLSRGPGLARLADGGWRRPGPLLDPASLGGAASASPICSAGRATPSPSRSGAWAAASAARRPRPRNGRRSQRWPRSRPDGPPSSASSATTT